MSRPVRTRPRIRGPVSTSLCSAGRVPARRMKIAPVCASSSRDASRIVPSQLPPGWGTAGRSSARRPIVSVSRARRSASSSCDTRGGLASSRCLPGVRSTSSSSRSMIGTASATSLSSPTSAGSLLNAVHARLMTPRTSSHVGPPSAGCMSRRVWSAEKPDVSTNRTCDGAGRLIRTAGEPRSAGRGRSARRGCGGREMTARSAPRRTRFWRTRRPDGRAAAAGGISMTTVPPGNHMSESVLDPREF